MNESLPAYYSELSPFRQVFETGNPILTYHKLGPRPRGTRIKGLYLSERLFARQLFELKRAGFESGGLASAAAPRAGRKVVITFDDGYVNVLQYGVAALASAGFRAIQFLVADLLGRCNEWDVPLGEFPEPMMDSSQ
ncbi:MAG TPA: hypothetical protein VFL42_12525, partial [Terriglobales bacterium]|nr:hypothetical protein [Terriglobales bacterium]